MEQGIIIQEARKSTRFHTHSKRIFLHTRTLQSSKENKKPRKHLSQTERAHENKSPPTPKLRECANPPTKCSKNWWCGSFASRSYVMAGSHMSWPAVDDCGQSLANLSNPSFMTPYTSTPKRSGVSKPSSANISPGANLSCSGELSSSVAVVSMANSWQAKAARVEPHGASSRISTSRDGDLTNCRTLSRWMRRLVLGLTDLGGIWSRRVVVGVRGGSIGLIS